MQTKRKVDCPLSINTVFKSGQILADETPTPIILTSGRITDDISVTKFHHRAQ